MPQLFGSGKATAPSAAAVLASITAPAAGRYKLKVSAMVSGSAAGDTANLKLKYNNADQVAAVPHGISGAWVTSEFDVVLNGTNDVQVVVVGVGTASIVYAATLTADLEDRP